MKQVLLDSNVLQYGSKPEYASDIANVLEKINTMSVKPALLAYTEFEVFRELAIERLPAMKLLVKIFNPVEVDNNSFKLAAILTTCYRNHPATKAFYNRYEDGDVVLAASAFRYDAYVLTANGNDFPRPFFAEKGSYTITNSKTRKTITLQLLKPNFAIFQAAIGDVYSNKTTKANP